MDFADPALARESRSCSLRSACGTRHEGCYRELVRTPDVRSGRRSALRGRLKPTTAIHRTAAGDEAECASFVIPHSAWEVCVQVACVKSRDGISHFADGLSRS